MVLIAPSLLSADFARLGEEVKRVSEAGADIIHFDVMDGHFVPNITFGPMVLAAIRDCTALPFEAHLMITHPESYWKRFAEAGADVIGIHVEYAGDIKKLVREIRGAGKKACLTINPPTPVQRIEPYLAETDQVLVMTVNPGFGGQDFMTEVVPKIEHIAAFRNKHKLDFPIEVDGGINTETAAIVKKAGADILVAGSFVFKSADYGSAIRELR